MGTTERQNRELEFHRQYAEQHASRASQPVTMDVVHSKERRWWNAYWSLYTLLASLGLKGRRVLIPGCGFGEDAFRVAELGAEVSAFDLSPEIVEIATMRKARHPGAAVRFDVMASESLSYPDDYFDLVLFLDILHHVDIPGTMKETRRVLKSGAAIAGNELYTHSRLQALRESFIVDKVLYKHMVRYIYGTSTPYITADEHKIDETEFSIVTSMCRRMDADYFNVFMGRLIPDRVPVLSKIDRALLKAMDPLARVLGGRVVFHGTMEK